MNISYIPAGMDFLKMLAMHLRDDSVQSGTHLSQYQILLPTRRAVRTLQSFLMPPDGSAALLPRIDAIGDLDDDILTLHMPDLNLPPVIARTARLGLLIQLIQEQEEMPWQRALVMAEALAKLLDESILREVPLTQLEDLVPNEIAEHWQRSLTWLQIIMARWPKILKERGEIDAATQRQNLLHHYAELWTQQKPDHPLIAAGSTGSLPATRNLLKAVANLPRGMVILPALDSSLPDDIWEELPGGHPQRNLKNMLDHFGITRRDVKPLCEHERDHSILWQQVLFPAEATEKWREDTFRLIKAGEINSKYIQNLHCVTADNAEEEAQAVALVMQRAAAENQTAALITPDRRLAQRTAARLARAGIEVNDTAGQSLDQSLPGRWLRMLLQCLVQQCDAVSLLGLLKHPLSCFGTTRAGCRAAARAIEKEFFRADIPVQNLAALLARADETLPLNAQLKLLCVENTPRDLRTWMELLQQLGDALAAEPNAASLLWQREAGDALSQLLAELAAHSAHFPELDLEALEDFMHSRMQEKTLHPRETHPNLQILGPLEARLHHYDVVILGGLNEGTWPQVTPADPWLSRPMRSNLQLAMPEEMLALTAHDFYQLATQHKVYLTRASFADGAPALPSRWWQRLIAYIQACQMDKDVMEEYSLLQAARALHAAPNVMPAVQPRPAPPADMRRKRYSPSAIETLMRNPYEFYAKYILGLRNLPGIGVEAAEKEQGELLHKIFAEFTKSYPASLPADSAEILDEKARAALAAQSLPEMLAEFWWQNWLTARGNFLRWQAAALAAGRRVVAVEEELSHEFPTPSGPVTLLAVADRIDVDAAGNFIIVDYKRKKSDLSKKKIIDLKKPQLAIEAWLLTQSGLPGHPARIAYNGEYWPLLEDQIIAEKPEKFAAALERLPAELGEFIDHYLRAENPFPARVLSNPFADQEKYIDLSRASEWRGRAA